MCQSQKVLKGTEREVGERLISTDLKDFQKDTYQKGLKDFYILLGENIFKNFEILLPFIDKLRGQYSNIN